MEQILQVYNSLSLVMSGILFWAGFLIFGFNAKRYSRVFNKNTFYVLLLIAPSGILIYSILLIFRTSLIVKDTKINDIFLIIAYLFFVLSSLFCFISVFKFNKILNELLKYQEKK